MALTVLRSTLFINVIAALFLSGECRVFDRRSTVTGVVGQKDTSCVKTNVDEYLDKVLERARQELPDPLRLPPRSTFVELSDGVAWGLSTLTRLGTADVHCSGSTIIIKIKLTAEELKGRYTWIKERRRHWEGYVTFLSNDFEADIVLAIEKHVGEVTHPRLERFEIKRFKHAKVEITGMHYISWALGEITTLMSGIFQRTIAGAIQGPLKEAIERQMREINIV